MMKRLPTKWTSGLIALVVAVFVCPDAQADRASALASSAKTRAKITENLNRRPQIELGPSPCAGGGVTLLGITSATPGTALSKLSNDDELNEAMRNLTAAYAEPLRKYPQLIQEVERLDQQLESRERDVTRQQEKLEEATERMQDARTKFKQAPTGDSEAAKAERERLRERYLQAVEEEKLQAAKLKGAIEQRDITIGVRRDVSGQLEDTDRHLSKFREDEETNLEKAREKVKRYGCT